MNALRRKLPNRRRGIAVQFDHDGVLFRAQVSYFPDGGLAEIFLDGGKVGSGVQIAASDAAVCASLVLQHGCSAAILSKALLKLPNGKSAGPLGRALDLVGEGSE